MSYQSLGFTQTLDADVDLSGSHQRFIDMNAGKAVLPDAGGAAIGVTLDKAALGQACPFQQLGIAQVIAGAGGIAVDAYVAADAAGGAVAAAAGDVVLGQCVVAAAAGGVASVLLIPNVTAVVAA